MTQVKLRFRGNAFWTTLLSPCRDNYSNHLDQILVLINAQWQFPLSHFLLTLFLTMHVAMTAQNIGYFIQCGHFQFFRLNCT
jgi:hypothetical protein